MRRLAWVLVLGSAVSLLLVAWPAVRVEPPVRGAPAAKASALAITRKCLKDHGYRGAGGSALVPDRATASPLGFGRWVVHVPETRRHTRPTGRDLVVDVALTTCQRAPMD